MFNKRKDSLVKTGARLVWKNMAQVKKKLDLVEANRLKAAKTASKVEAFRLSKKLKAGITAGDVGGAKWKKLTVIAARGNKGAVKRNPLKPMAKMIRYQVGRVAGKYNIEIGFVGKTMSGAWKRIAEMQQQGKTVSMGSSRAEFGAVLATIGARMSRGRNKSDAKYFFLKKSTRTFKTPKRDIIDPFWARNKTDAQRNIIRNWERKMAGERI